MSPHPHLVDFDTSSITLYKQAHVFCFDNQVKGQEMLCELIQNENGVFEDLLILVRIKGTLYRYVSPKPIDTQLSQVQLAYVIRNRLGKTSNRQQFLEKMSAAVTSLEKC